RRRRGLPRLVVQLAVDVDLLRLVELVDSDLGHARRRGFRRDAALDLNGRRDAAVVPLFRAADDREPLVRLPDADGDVDGRRPHLLRNLELLDVLVDLAGLPGARSERLIVTDVTAERSDAVDVEDAFTRAVGD